MERDRKPGVERKRANSEMRGLTEIHLGLTLSVILEFNIFIRLKMHIRESSILSSSMDIY